MPNQSQESRTGLDPWTPGELPAPPVPKGLSWIGVVGPGVIVLGVALGGGEFLLGPAAFVRHGLSLLWVTTLSVFFQTIFNTELMRYTMATGEPVFTGFMRTRPSSTAWAWFYSALFVFQVGWPASAGNAAGAIFYMFYRRLAGNADAAPVYYFGVASFLVCVLILLAGRRIERTLELLNWGLVVCSLGGFFLLAIFYVPLRIWISAAAGFAGFDTTTGTFRFIPEGVDFFLLAALVAYSGAGGVTNLTLSNWARDKGYGMAKLAGYIPAVVGGQKVNLAHAGFRFTPTPEALKRWRGWWRIVRADQWGIFFIGAMAGMALPALLYMTFLPPGTDIQGLGIAAALADSIGRSAGPAIAGVVVILGAWILFKTQLDLTEGMVRAITDILWTGSRRIRSWRGGDVRAVYYTVLGTVTLWGIFALRLAQPIFLLQIAANVAGVVLTIAAIHVLYINTRLLPRELRPPRWRRVTLVAMALFYGFFVALSVRSLW